MELYRLEKNNLKTNIVFVENLDMDPIDKWFINIYRVYKNGRKDLISTIIKKDIRNRIDKYIRDGWNIVNE